MKGKILAIVVIACVAFAACKQMAPCNSTVYRGAVVNNDSVADFDGNKYSIVKIGSQNWLQQNLKCTHFQNGTLIIQSSNDSVFAGDSLKGLDSVSWSNTYNFNASNAVWCYYNGDSANNRLFGKLYNWYAVTSPNQLCPVGFHVPSDAEWHTLMLTLDACAVVGDPESATAGSQLKTVTVWTKGDTTATNASKFSAYPAGNCDPNRTFFGLDSLSYFWTATQDYSYSAWDRKLNSADSSVDRYNGEKHNGFSVRCVGN